MPVGNVYSVLINSLTYHIKIRVTLISYPIQDLHSLIRIFTHRGVGYLPLQLRWP